MPVSRDEVIWSYRLFLEREPENDAIIAAKEATPGVSALRHDLLGSAEYRSANPGELVIGRFVDEPPNPVEVDAAPADVARMVARVAAGWRAFGETEPHWSVLVSDRFSAANIDANIDAFYETGRHDMPALLDPLARAGRTGGRIGRVLDFGCGVGRLSLALAEHADDVLGIDISSGHIRLAEARAASAGIANARFRAIDTPDDLDGVRGIDLVVSLIVLQHNPPPVMAILLRKLLRTLAPGGYAVLQMPTFLLGYTFAVADYLANAQPQMEMNVLPQPAIFAIAHDEACRTMEVREDGRIGDMPGVSQTFVFRRAG